MLTVLYTDYEKAIKLLAASKCPDPNCNGNGVSWYVSFDRFDDLVQEQYGCSWCQEREKICTQTAGSSPIVSSGNPSVEQGPCDNPDNTDPENPSKRLTLADLFGAGADQGGSGG